ncbi:MAG: radical SAM protein [bacterium]|nr:radical SAM protein [bacterium]
MVQLCPVDTGGCSIDGQSDTPLRVFADHSRRWRDYLYVYPVISRRSRGLSIGINLNPDTACNFDCIYCQVDRETPPRVRRVDLKVLAEELDHMVGLAAGGALFDDPKFADTPSTLRRVNDLAFSGDGEPTTFPQFAEAVEIAADVKRRHGLEDAKIVLITDACYLTRPEVEAGLRVLDANNGEIWAKLDAGTEEYYRLVNRPNYPLRHVLENILAAAKTRPLVIQAMWMRIDGQQPADAEVDAFADRLSEIVAGGGALSGVQIYTVARKPAVENVAALNDRDLTELARRVSDRTGIATETFTAS